MNEIFFNPVDLVAMGQRIKRVRNAHHLSVGRFAEILSVSENAVYKWQRGETAPDIVNIGIISTRFRVSLDYLILGVGDDGESSPGVLKEKAA